MKMAKNLQNFSESGKQTEPLITKDQSVILKKLYQFYEELFPTKDFLEKKLLLII